MGKKVRILSWLTSAIAALIMLQTLFYKFSGAGESIYIFSLMGMEPWGRYGTGIFELAASALILFTSTRGIGALLGAGIMGGAILSHIFILGIEVMDDGGQLFIYGIITFISCIFNVWLFRHQIPVLNKILN